MIPLFGNEGNGGQTPSSDPAASTIEETFQAFTRSMDLDALGRQTWTVDSDGTVTLIEANYDVHELSKELAQLRQWKEEAIESGVLPTCCHDSIARSVFPAVIQALSLLPTEELVKTFGNVPLHDVAANQAFEMADAYLERLDRHHTEHAPPDGSEALN